VNVFHVFGGLLALWALVVSFLGITRENFPGSDRVMRLLFAISVLLVALAIASAIYNGATEKPSGNKSAALLPV
jgi:predicted membrane channel-forming protein YqfA (hemolysin III family)